MRTGVPRSKTFRVRQLRLVSVVSRAIFDAEEGESIELSSRLRTCKAEFDISEQPIGRFPGMRPSPIKVSLIIIPDTAAMNQDHRTPIPSEGPWMYGINPP